MILSIGMITKNAGDLFLQCLEALKPLREALGAQCELIIADTGSEDSTPETTKKYADRFFTAKWNDDFAEARNITLRAATGEWFMFIDADEILSGGAEIAEFFTSGESERFNSATYIQRNYTDYDEKSYSDFRPARLTKILPETVFVGNVHESLSTFGEPIKNFSAFVKHYGYVKGVREQKAAERLRQLKIRFEAETDINGKLLALCEMSDAARITDPKKAAEIDIQGLELSKREGAYYYAKYVFGAKCADTLLYKKQYQAAAFAVSEFILNRSKAENESERMAMANDIDLHAILMLSLFYMKKYEQAAELLFAYASLLEDFFAGELYSADYYFNNPSYSEPANIKKCADTAGTMRIKLKNRPEASEKLAVASAKLQKCIRGER
ncbi:MAG: glycosyltransferase [Ruminococcus sp.]|jgi:glycosyltransferase involved in cell wall biosynthesis|nr:glycosyltransferase [Ruminococcus sp.]